MKAKTTRPGTVANQYKTSSGCKWEIYHYLSKYVKLWGNRLIHRNGNLICSNKDFNTKTSAVKNMRSVSKNAPL